MCYSFRMTTLSILLSPETEARLRERAAAVDKDPATFVREAVEAMARVPHTFAEVVTQVRQQFAASGMSDTELDTLLQSTFDAARRDRHATEAL